MAHLSLNLGSGFQSISLKFDKHFLFHQMGKLISHLIVLFLEYDVVISEFFKVKVEFFLFLLYSLVVHFIEISLFE